MNREIVWTAQFKKDDKLAMKRHMDMDLLDHIIRALSRGETLPERNKDHSLTGDWVGHRECHIQPDWLLAYRMEEDVLVLTLARTGTPQRFVWQIIRYRRMGSKTSCTAVLYPQGKGNRREIGGIRGLFLAGAHCAPLQRLCTTRKNLHHEPGAYAYASGDGRGGGWLRRQRAGFWGRERDLMARSPAESGGAVGAELLVHRDHRGAAPGILGPPACVVGGQAAGEVIGDAGVEGAVPALEDVNSPHGAS